MKKLMLMGIVAMAASFASAITTNYWTVTLSTTNAVVHPRSQGYTATPATNSTAYSAGSYITMPNGKDYWTPDGGTYTTANAPVHRKGIKDDDGDGIQWYYIPSSTRSVTIQLLESGDVWFSEGGAGATANASRLLTGKGMGWIFDEYTGEINALAGSTTKAISITVR